jgi:hypothetical protein
LKTYRVTGDFSWWVKADNPKEANAKVAAVFKHIGLDVHSVNEVTEDKAE